MDKEALIDFSDIYMFEYEDFNIVYDSGFLFIQYYDEEDTEIEELLDDYLEKNSLEDLEKKGFNREVIDNFLKENLIGN